MNAKQIFEEALKAKTNWRYPAQFQVDEDNFHQICKELKSTCTYAELNSHHFPNACGNVCAQFEIDEICFSVFCKAGNSDPDSIEE